MEKVGCFTLSNITLFTTDCPKCRVLEHKLNAQGIQYTAEHDVQEILDKGYKTAPILKVDGEYMDFPTANKWLNDMVLKFG